MVRVPGVISSTVADSAEAEPVLAASEPAVALLLDALLPEEQPTRASAATMTAMAARTKNFLAFIRSPLPIGYLPKARFSCRVSP